jgi:hypothetical protein
VPAENAVKIDVIVHTSTLEICRLASAVVSVRPRTRRSTANTAVRSSVWAIAGHARRQTSSGTPLVVARVARPR